nr:MAG TPA: Chromatin remodeling complex ATPase [Caudoviricetes sp.]
MSRQAVKLLSRDERQAVCIEKWKANNGHGTVVGATGFGKTMVASNTIKWLQEKHPNIRVIVVVPTTTLQEQWVGNLQERKCFTEHIQVYVINSVIKNNHECDLLILDEAHRYPADSFSAVFKTVKYFMIMCLTATFERLDGKHILLSKYAPVVDQVTVQECLANNWVSNYKEYAVVIEPADIEVYNDLTQKFTEHFEYFDFDFGLAMSMVGKDGWKHRNTYAYRICSNPSMFKDTLKAVTLHAVGLLRAIQARKKYIYNHPEKLRIAEEIIAHRSDKKIITFSASVAAAERFKDGFIYTGKESKKANRITLDRFNKMPVGSIHSVKLGEEGLDIPNLSVGIMLGVNSSKTKHAQTRGRVIRYHEGKEAEFFTLILKDTIEVDWWRRSNSEDSCEIIDEENLMKVLRHEPYETYKEPLKRFTSRF